MVTFDVSEPYRLDAEYTAVFEQLNSAPALVSVDSIMRLKTHLAQAAQGLRSIVQAGECAELFSHSNQSVTRTKQKQLMALAQTLKQHQTCPVSVIGRWAGQYAKPRSTAWSSSGQLSYHGDLIHAQAGDAPEVKRLIQGYRHASQVIQSLKWPGRAVFTSHEGLILPYERAMCREIPTQGIFNVGAHLIWLGMRSWDDDRLIKLLSAIENPIALKLGPQVEPDQLYEKVMQLNPQHQPGRMMLITRIGCDSVRSVLPAWLERMRSMPYPIVWLCDPLHGNTHHDANGLKYRLMSEIFKEIQNTFQCHIEQGSRCAGLHLEVSIDDNIQECISSTRLFDRRYTSRVDPRLTTQQALACINAIPIEY